jgi:hypothetical protein
MIILPYCLFVLSVERRFDMFFMDFCLLLSDMDFCLLLLSEFGVGLRVVGIDISSPRFLEIDVCCLFFAVVASLFFTGDLRVDLISPDLFVANRSVDGKSSLCSGQYAAGRGGTDGSFPFPMTASLRSRSCFGGGTI